MMFSGHLRFVDIDTSNCLHLKAGDAIQTSITTLKGEKYFTLYAEKEQADWLEDNQDIIEEDSIYRVKIKLLYGHKKSVEWGSYDLVEKYEEEAGLLLMDTPSYVGKNTME